MELGDTWILLTTFVPGRQLDKTPTVGLVRISGCRCSGRPWSRVTSTDGGGGCQGGGGSCVYENVFVCWLGYNFV